MVDGEIKAFALNDDVLAYTRTGKDDEAATVIINRSLRNSHCVTIPALGECASDVISGHECEIHNGTVTLDLYPLGSSIIYHHARSACRSRSIMRGRRMPHHVGTDR